MKTKVINLIGGPGSGKSTLAADLYAQMKRLGKDVEMVREVAKKYALAGHKIGPFEQLCILGEQIKEESALYDKVEYIVTDSAVVLGAFYCEYYHHQAFMGDMVRQYYIYAQDRGVEFLNLWVEREKPYDSRGRFESETQAKELDLSLKRYLKDNHYPINVKNIDDLFKVN